MCGIFGWHRVDALGRERDSAAARAAASLRHRGPDGSAVVHRGAATLGMTRLAVVDAASPAEAASSADGLVFSVCNGEILNHGALRERLARSGIPSRGRCDTALIPDLYRVYGPSFVEGLEGFFAIALYDTARDELHLYRDRLGKKPLYLRRVAGGVVFASEQKGIVAAGPGPFRPRPEAAARFLRLGFLEEDDLLIDGIEALPAAAHLRVRAGGTETAVYWRPAGHGAAADPRRAVFEAFERSVALRRESEVPSAVLLSGGLDSTLVAAAARPAIGAAYSIRVRGHDESAKAAAAAAALGLELRVHEVEAETWASFRTTLWHSEHPDAYLSYGVTAALRSLAGRLRRDGVKVVLSGQGADEVFLGYPWAAMSMAAEHPDPPSCPRILGRSMRQSLDAFLEAHRLLRLLGADPTALQAFLAAPLPEALAVSEDVCARYIGGDIRGGGWGSRPRLPAGVPRFGVRGRQLEGLTRDMGSGPILQSERAMMSAGVEERMPFLDRALVEAACAAPGGMLEGWGLEKPLLRHLAKQVLPSPLAEVPKRGFYAPEVPAGEVLEEGLAELLRHGGLVADPPAVRDALVRRDALSFVLGWRALLVETALRVVISGPG